MNKTKVLMIALQHRANDDRIFYKEALSLKKHGFKVSYLLLTDNDGYIRDMSGNILNKDKETSFILNGINIIGVEPPRDLFNIYLKKIFLGSFQNKLKNAILKVGADIYHAHEPVSLRFAINISKITHKKVIFDSHESWRGGTIKEKIIKLFYLKKIKYLITVNEGIQQILTKRNSLIKFEIIYNCSLPSLFSFNNSKIKLNQPIQLVHEGSLNFNRGLKTMLEAILILSKIYPNINLKIVGGSPKKESEYITNFIYKHQLQNNINRLGWVMYQDVSSNLINCDIGLILFSPTKNNYFSTSNKLFNYIASSLAIITVDLPETNKILLPLDNSIILKNNDSKNIANAVIELIQKPDILLNKKRESRKAYRKYNWLNEEKKLIAFYNKVITD